ncbi:SGNH hydrolase-type esterase domain-containing protein [Mycena albidolilacea]|uniref:SGNH hydrolase-type esterase domain-containing protein n=1 Tax=Mycena albidolilacea TaxID=1033008 RepID=A0AAD7F2X6_9AGAR|nr:SGNH hydrolase-type esterase domain-containing protein [Mycena albidolilacea]
MANVQDVIMLFGDSITQAGWAAHGFGARLVNAYSRKLDVPNRGLAGYNTDCAIPVLEQQDQKHLPKVTLLVLWFGANDAVIQPFSKHIPLPKFIENLNYMVHLVHFPESPYYSPSTKIILITLPPVNTHQQGVKAAAAASKVAAVDVWTAIWNAASQDEQALSRYLSDGRTVTRQVVFEALMKTVAVEHPELHYEKLRRVFPAWNEVDWTNP